MVLTLAISFERLLLAIILLLLSGQGLLPLVGSYILVLFINDVETKVGVNLVLIELKLDTDLSHLFCL